ncbi:hypothetical protein HMPREF0043_01921 [Actinobaculum sp. oral taxon 183 str. F0552]|nr:hypothetical protein HMPREF0043_01921 [Actinobaculum sp. oral taxon 183 str. F0552]
MKKGARAGARRWARAPKARSKAGAVSGAKAAPALWAARGRPALSANLQNA